jgi:hypothetical protein
MNADVQELKDDLGTPVYTVMENWCTGRNDAMVCLTSTGTLLGMDDIAK